VVKPELELGGRQDQVGLVRISQEARCRGEAPPESPRRSACLLPLSLCKPLALVVVFKTALSCISEAP
jgi:hypothetical protein